MPDDPHLACLGPILRRCRLAWCSLLSNPGPRSPELFPPLVPTEAQPRARRSSPPAMLVPTDWRRDRHGLTTALNSTSTSSPGEPGPAGSSEAASGDRKAAWASLAGGARDRSG